MNPKGRERATPTLRERLLSAAAQALEDGGPEAVQARALTAAVGTSTQAIYTQFGGMPGLFEALIAHGFARFGAHITSVPDSRDPVADHFAKGGAYVGWALANPQLYRLMFGLTGGSLRLHPGLEMTVSRALESFPEGQAAVAVLVGSLDRVQAANRIRAADTLVVAAQFLSATHGFVLLAIAGAYPDTSAATAVISELAVNLMVGLGDDPRAARRSMQEATRRRNA